VIDLSGRSPVMQTTVVVRAVTGSPTLPVFEAAA
jgi:hypothetical protein